MTRLHWHVENSVIDLPAADIRKSLLWPAHGDPGRGIQEQLLTHGSRQHAGAELADGCRDSLGGFVDALLGDASLDFDSSLGNLNWNVEGTADKLGVPSMMNSRQVRSLSLPAVIDCRDLADHIAAGGFASIQRWRVEPISQIGVLL